MARFRTIVVFEGVETGDKRKIGTGALTTRALPLTLMAMDHNPEGGWGHDGAEVAGRIDTLTREDASSWVDEATGQTWGEVAGGQVFAWVGEGEFEAHPVGHGARLQAPAGAPIRALRHLTLLPPAPGKRRRRPPEPPVRGTVPEPCPALPCLACPLTSRPRAPDSW